MGFIFQPRVKRTLVTVFAEVCISGVWAMIDAQFVAAHAGWFVGVGLAGILCTYWFDRIRKYVAWEKNQISEDTGGSPVGDDCVSDEKQKPPTPSGSTFKNIKATGNGFGMYFANPEGSSFDGLTATDNKYGGMQFGGPPPKIGPDEEPGDESKGK